MTNSVMDREAWRAAIRGVAKSWTRLSNWTELNWINRHLRYNKSQIPILSWFFQSSVPFSSVAQSRRTVWDLMDCSMPGFPVHHQLLEHAQTHVLWVSDTIQLSHPLSSPSPAFNLCQHQGLFQWVSSSHLVAKVLELRLQHQSFQWTLRTNL